MLLVYQSPLVLFCSRWIVRSGGLAAGLPNPAGVERATTPHREDYRDATRAEIKRKTNTSLVYFAVTASVFANTLLRGQGVNDRSLSRGTMCGIIGLKEP